MFDPRLTETLSDYPVARLNHLLAGLAPPAIFGPINMSVGEPQGTVATPQADEGVGKPVIAIPDPFCHACPAERYRVALVHDARTTRESRGRLASVL